LKVEVAVEVEIIFILGGAEVGAEIEVCGSFHQRCQTVNTQT
jgi:hypothetical protein